MNQNNDNSELVRIVRENVHKNASRFGDTVKNPANALYSEMVKHPESFSVDERILISEIYTHAVEDGFLFQSLGKPLSYLLDRLSNGIIPRIRENVDKYNVLIKNESLSRGCVAWLRNSIAESKGLIECLSKIEEAGYGEPEEVLLSRYIKSYTTTRNGRFAILGDPCYYLEFFFGGFRDATVLMNVESFECHVLEHLFDNFDQHAFSGSDYQDGLKRKDIRIDFEEDASDNSRMNILIRNNGKPFNGDLNAVFEYSIGHGSGIGLFSAKRFITSLNGTISMLSYRDAPFTVGFNINLPIYGHAL